MHGNRSVKHVPGRKRRGLCLMCLVLLAPMVGCANSQAPKAPGMAGASPAVVVVPIEVKTVPIQTEFVARTDAVQTVEIRARVEAILKEMAFEEGRRVKKDQLLFKLDSASYDAALQSARSQLSKAKADLKYAKDQVSLKRAEAQLKQAQAALVKSEKDVARIEPLVRDEAVSAQELDAVQAQLQVAEADVVAQQANVENARLNQDVSIEQAEAAVKAAESAVTQAELNLSYTTITCPVDGIIGRADVSVGNLVGRGEPTLLATVSTIDPIKVTFSLSETDYLKFAKKIVTNTAQDSELELVLADGSTYPHKGRFTTLERAFDATTGSLVIEAEFANPDRLLRPGQFARVRADVEEVKDAVLVPQRAVQELQGIKTVMVVDGDNKVSVKTVILGNRYNQYYVVREGLQGGENVILEGHQKARPGQPVTPTAKAASEEPR